ncbi:MAG: hypothetical protein ACREF7_04735 [Candidatus Saccharimonadales bacterium]
MSTDDLVSWLLGQEPHIALQWLRKKLSEGYTFPDNFSWQSVAEYAAADACANSRNAFHSNLEWAYVAALAYSYLIQMEKDSAHLAHKLEMKKNMYHAYQLKLMQVRVNSILAFGPILGDAVCDVNQLVQSFFEEISLLPEDLLETLTSPKKERPFGERMELYWLRQKLRVLQPLEKKHILPVNQELALWFSVWNRVLAAYKQRE